MSIFPGQRLTFNNCRLLKRTEYVSTFRHETRRIWRHVINSDYGLLIYSGNRLPFVAGETLSIRATIKCRDNWGAGAWRICRPFVLDKLDAPLYA
jgi:hypothetical protein